MSIGPVDRTAWPSGELPSLEGRQWHRESGDASRVENVKSMKRRGRTLQVPTLMGQKREEKELPLSHSKAGERAQIRVI